MTRLIVISKTINQICSWRQIFTGVQLFGSYARDETTPESDLYLLVEFAERKSLLTLARIRRELTEILGLEVDLLDSSKSRNRNAQANGPTAWSKAVHFQDFVRNVLKISPGLRELPPRLG